MTENKKINIVSIMWGSYLPAFIKAAKESRHVDLTIFSQKEIVNDSDILENFFKAAKTADAILFYWTHDTFFEEIRARIEQVNKDAVIVTISFDPTNWGLCATVSQPDCAIAYGYMAEGGKENYKRLLEYTAHFLQPEIQIKEPIPMPWQGILCPPDWQVYETFKDFVAAHPFKHDMTVGILFSRHTFTNGDAALENALIEAFGARKVNVLPVFCNGTPDSEAGSLGPIKAAETWFFDKDGKPLIHALINLHYFFLGREMNDDLSETGVAAQSVALFKKLNVPVFKPLVSYSKSVEEWEKDPQGLTAEVGFGIAMPEFEGNIEPVLVAASRKVTDEKTDTGFEITEVIPERVEHLADRVTNFIKLGQKRPEERKVVFVFHKNECAGLEANIGGAGGLDSGESVVRIMNEMGKLGYKINDIPESGEDLMQLFLDRKAIAEFRWTTVDEIIRKKGNLALLDSEIYQQWFDELPKKAQDEMIEGWGLPPGQEMNGVPPSMVHEGQLVITGLNFGNVNVIMQPKRGCAGSRCDGQVCKILHDPDIPPPHQYIATYMYMEKIFKADVIIHVGTHGNLEWLPGKGAGLSNACWPDIAIGRLPHLYIYNSDNPAEGVVAKRRSYAVLVNHLQAMLTISDTYEGLKDLEDLLNQYGQARDTDPARAHQIEHLIQEAIDKNNLRKEVDAAFPADFQALTERCHELISSVKNSQTAVGMHVFGEIPEKDDLAEYINTILRFDTNNELNTRRLVFDLWGEDIFDALQNPGGHGKSGRPYSDLLFDSDRKAKEIIARIIEKQNIETILKIEFGSLPGTGLLNRLQAFSNRVLKVAGRMNDSKEIKSLLNAVQGGHVPAGPSGFISRGRYDILPTGRNLYNVDPTRIPTKAAWQVGVKLADALIERYKKEEGAFPRSVGMVWFASDIMRSDGEQIGQIFHLLGVRPKWKGNGQINGFDIIPLQELDRPRIDVNIRVSGITRDCFPDAVKYVDEAICAVALLNEDHQSNFIRKHVLEQAARKGLDPENSDEFRRLSFRLFCAQPGVYRAGVNLAVYASAWKTEQDLADVYLFWNGYAYGAGENAFGVEAHPELMENLKRVQVTFDKHISDETDFLKCCGFYSNYGGMTVAAKAISGKKPKTYYGDTRDPANVSVTDFADELRRVVRAKLLNPKYIDGMKQHGYKGAGDLNKRISRVYGFGATTGEVDNWIFDEIAEKFILDPEMKDWFEKVNPWAMEEIGRRLLEAQSRDIWDPDPELLERLKEAYLDTEACLEDRMGDVAGDFQGGAVDIMTSEDVESWTEKMKDIKKIMREAT
ncbi:cobaltochelatase subunit CobN [Desulfobacula phenolica]|uniref:Cobaltochelatase CobN subunit n=1 Tax=Desulfobacula phenolica TaxID=90732 RepID=A0A1H2ICC2_9BACT|nr:cobaltochelatase subunit CobN [Desulfobacula phenolica]SDU41782.1 cobaltochelatase CobN subunit [Desulfobacula phenolica]